MCFLRLLRDFVSCKLKKNVTSQVIPCKHNLLYKICTLPSFLWFTKVKYVNSSLFPSSIESASPLFYRFNQNILVHSELQIRKLDIQERSAELLTAVFIRMEGVV